MIHFRTIALVFCSVFLMFTAEGNCATIAAKSLSPSDVQAAINSAAEGDTVTIPAGSATWSSAVTINNKAVSVVGAGMDSTVITCSNVDAFNINSIYGKFFRISGMTFKGSPGGNGYSSFIINIMGTSRAWRVDHIHFDSTSGGFGMVGVDGYCYGVIDNCLVTGAQPQHWFVRPYDSSYSAPYDSGSYAWKRPLTLGTENAVYIESNTIKYDQWVQGSTSPVWDSRSGGRYVVRYNTIRNGFAGHHGAEAYHARGTFSWEIYNNTFEYDGTIWTPLNIRGGSGVIFNNTFIFHAGNTGNPFIIGNYRSDNQASGVPWLNKCDSVPDYICTVFNGDQDPTKCSAGGEVVQTDGNVDGTGWPCRDQIGVTYNGTDDRIQASAPVYEWNNVAQGGNSTNVDFLVNGSATHLKLGRDYYNDTPKPGYAPYAYPHPLSTGSTGGGTATVPGAPSNLRMQ